MQRLSGSICIAGAIVGSAAGLTAPTAQAAGGGKVSLSGRVQMSHSDSFSGGRTSFERYVTSGPRRYRLLGSKAARLAPGSKVKITGQKKGSDVNVDAVTTVDAREPLATQAGAARALRAGPTIKRVAIVLFRYQNDPQFPTNTEISQRLFSLLPGSKSTSAFFREISDGQFMINAGILGPYTINQNRPAGCDWQGQFVPQAKAAVPAGASLYTYDLPVYISPVVAACGTVAGASSWGSPQSYSFINGLPADQESTTRVVAHELGHQLYLHHASAYLCDPRGQIQPMGSSCRAEYGDPFDAMGNSMRGTTPIPVRQFSGFHKAQLASRGIPVPAAIQSVTKSGTYQLSPSNANTASQPTGLAIDRPNTSWDTGYYYLETRAGNGVFDNFNCSVTPSTCDSVQIRIGPHYLGGPLTQSLLVDATPQTAGNFDDAPLGPGQTFSDEPHGFVVTNLGIGPSGVATVRIDITDKLAPTTPSRFVARAANGYVKLSWSRSYDFAGNHASGDLGPIAGYDVYRDGQKIGSTTAKTLMDVPSPGNHSYEVRGRDPTGNVSPASQSSSVTMAGDPAHLPSVTITDPVDGARVGGPVEVVGTATGHGSSIRSMRMFVDGRKTGAHSGNLIIRSWDPQSPKVTSGAHRIVISAMDQSGNTGSDEIVLNK